MSTSSYKCIYDFTKCQKISMSLVSSFQTSKMSEITCCKNDFFLPADRFNCWCSNPYQHMLQWKGLLHAAVQSWHNSRVWRPSQLLWRWDGYARGHDHCCGWPWRGDLHLVSTDRGTFNSNRFTTQVNLKWHTVMMTPIKM